MKKAAIILMFLPVFAFAQSDALRAQIRADLMQDPRTAEMSEAELNALIDALAEEASETGVAETYLDAQTAPTFTYDSVPLGETNPYVLILTAPIVIATFALLAGICGVILLLIRRGRRQPPPDLQNS